MDDNPRVIAILDNNKVVTGFAHFTDEGQFDRMFKECQKKGQNVRIMGRNEAREYMKSEEPII